MKHPVSLILALLLSLSFIGCLGPEAPGAVVYMTPTAVSSETASPVPSVAPTAPPTEAPTQTPAPTPWLRNDNEAAHRKTVRYGAYDALSELYELAAEIGNRYGIYLYIADLVPDCIFESGDELQSDPALIRSALLKIDEILALYPKGYFDQLVYDQIACLDFYLVGFSPTGMGYVSDRPEGEQLHSYMVLDAETQDLIDAFDYTLPHEITHLTDWRLTYVSETEPGHLFSEERWMDLNPQGFSYAYGDQDKELAMYDQYYTYFSYSYGTETPLEDRATLFGDLMSRYFLSDERFSCSGPCYAKLEYYLRCLRDGFDTADWPSETTWEAMFARTVVDH